MQQKIKIATILPPKSTALSGFRIDNLPVHSQIVYLHSPWSENILCNKNFNTDFLNKYKQILLFKELLAKEL